MSPMPSRCGAFLFTPKEVTMKTIGRIDKLPDLLSVFIRETCPWMDEDWEPDSIGYLFVLDDDDIGTTTINPLPKEDYFAIDNNNV